MLCWLLSYKSGDKKASLLFEAPDNWGILESYANPGINQLPPVSQWLSRINENGSKSEYYGVNHSP